MSDEADIIGTDLLARQRIRGADPVLIPPLTVGLDNPKPPLLSPFSNSFTSTILRSAFSFLVENPTTPKILSNGHSTAAKMKAVTKVGFEPTPFRTTESCFHDVIKDILNVAP